MSAERSCRKKEGSGKRGALVRSREIIRVIADKRSSLPSLSWDLVIRKKEKISAFPFFCCTCCIRRAYRAHLAEGGGYLVLFQCQIDGYS